MPDLARRVYAILEPRSRGIEIHPALPLGADGLGLDSIALVEVLLECEDVFGVRIAAELLGSSPLTAGSVIEALRARE